MSYYRVEDGAKISGAHRPWNEPTGKGYQMVQESEADRRERETCLACPLPECKPSSINCPVRNYKNVAVKKKAGRKRLEPPAVFVKHGMNRTSNKEWAEHLGVSASTIQKWRQKLGYQRMTLKRKTKG